MEALHECLCGGAPEARRHKARFVLNCNLPGVCAGKPKVGDGLVAEGVTEDNLRVTGDDRVGANVPHNRPRKLSPGIAPGASPRPTLPGPRRGHTGPRTASSGGPCAERASRCRAWPPWGGGGTLAHASAAPRHGRDRAKPTLLGPGRWPPCK